MLITSHVKESIRVYSQQKAKKAPREEAKKARKERAKLLKGEGAGLLIQSHLASALAEEGSGPIKVPLKSGGSLKVEKQKQQITLYSFMHVQINRDKKKSAFPLLIFYLQHLLF